MILHMIQLDPEARLSCESYLQNYASVVFPSYFSPLLHNFFSYLMPLDTDTRVTVTQGAFSEIHKQMTMTYSDKEVKNEINKAFHANVNETPLSSSMRQSLRLHEDSKGCFNKNGDFGKVTIRHLHPELIGDISALQKEVEQLNCKQPESHTSDRLPAITPGNCVIRKNEECVRSLGEKKNTCSNSLQTNAERILTDKSFAFRHKENNVKDNLMLGCDRNLDALVRPSLSNLQSCTNCEGMVLIASLLCACVRNVRLSQSRRGALLLLLRSSYYIDDEDRLQHVLPYVVSVLSDPAAIVRCAALQTVCDVLSLVQTFTPSDAKIFPEYILPMLSMLPDDPEESVRICYSENIYKIAVTASRFLMRSQDLSQIGSLDRSSVSHKASNIKVPFGPAQGLGSQVSGHQQNSTCDAELAQLRQTIGYVIQELVMGPKQTPIIRRALLQHIRELCHFFGQKQSNDFLLPILPAFLNDRDEQLRAVFFEQIVNVCFFVGQTSVEEYLLPYIEQALNDVVEEVIVNALKCLAALCKEKLLRKRLLLDVVKRAAPLLCHPSQWVRRSAVTFIAASSENLDSVDSYVYVSPILLPFLRREPASLCSEIDLLSCLKSPMSRKVFHQVLEKAKNSQWSEMSENSQSKVRQRSGFQKSAEPSLNQSNAPFSSKKIPEKRATVSSLAADLVASKSWPVKQSDLHAGSSGQVTCLSEVEDGVKMKAMESYIRNLSSTMQTREHTRELENSEKLQGSGVGLPPYVGAGNGSNYDGLSEGIPLYSLPLSERKLEMGPNGSPSIGPSLNDECSRIFGGRQGNAPFLMTTISGAQVAGSVASSLWTSLGPGHSSMPAAETMDKSISMAGSLPLKLVSGSILNGSYARPKQVYKVIRDAAGRENDQIANVTSKLKDAIVSDTSSKGILSSIDPTAGAPSLSDAAILSSYSGAFVPDGAWRPQGVLVAHLHEHQLAVNDIAVSHDHKFFVSASDDCTVKIWDTRKLEKDISFQSRLTYPLDKGRALHVAMLASGPQVAVASSSGTIYVFSVDYVPKERGSVERYSGISNEKRKDTQEGAVLSLQNYSTDGPPMILYSTQRNCIHLWDLRAKCNAWTLKESPEDGYISSVVLGPCQNWLVSGTSRGVLTLWDLRFLIPVNTWQYPLGCAVEKMCLLIPPPNASSSITNRPLVYVAAGCNEVALWNAENGSCHQVFRLPCSGTDAEVSEIPTALARPSSQLPSKLGVVLGTKQNGNSKYRVDELNAPPPRLPGIRSLLPLQGGDVLTGGTDLKIRLWDHFSPDHSYCVCGPSTKNTTTDEYYDMRSILGVQVVQEANKHSQSSKVTTKATLAAAATDSAGCHRDCILSMASVQLTQRLLISSSRDGAIKVWK
eukprot:Gb_24427 [translate_table: standard]